MKVEALVFDLYGTLLDVRSLDRVGPAETGGPESFVTMWRQKQLEYTWLRAAMGRYTDFWAVTGEALDYTLERLGLSVDPGARRRLMDAWLTLLPYREVPAALGQLRATTLAVLSNGSPPMLDRALRAADLHHLFAHVISVDEVGAYKPVPAVYALAEGRLGLNRSVILFVSSNAWDAAGAKAFGLRVAWVNRTGAPAERLGFAPDLIVRDLEELVDHVRG
ncbi:MAG TPA: haloacid dehalogenase type II [bacterium]|nr:haloacid dehalogenase type II [bacterium]